LERFFNHNDCAGIEMVGNDLKWRSSTASPTLKISEMMIAGA
jgi:predicted Zn-dependent protease